jgi:predicted nucleic acid-binding protein
MTTNVAYAVDSSSLIAYVEGETGKDTMLLDELIPARLVLLPPPVIVEVLSNIRTRHLVEPTLRRLKTLDFKEDFWFRASLLRADILAKKLKANLADTLIAQSCIDHGVALITRDTDFRHFAKHGGLKLAVRG